MAQNQNSNRNRNQSQKNIGDQIADAVTEAISSQDFSQLQQTVQASLTAAAASIKEGLSQAAAEAQAQRDVQQRQQGSGASYPPPYNQNPLQDNNQRLAHEQSRQRQMARRRQDMEMRRQQAQARLQQAQQRRQQAQLMNSRFAPGPQGKGIVCTVLGAVFSFTFGSGLITMAIGAAVTPLGLFDPSAIAALGGAAVFFAGSLGLLGYGISNMTLGSRFNNYKNIIGDRQYCEVKELAARTGRSVQAVQKDLRKMLDKGMFRQAALTDDGGTLVITREAYQQYLASLESKRQRELQERMVENVTPQGEQAHLSAEEQRIIDKGYAYIAKIRSINDEIPNEAVTAKIDQIELVVDKIFGRAKEHPEVIDDLEKLMNYYLPITVKLLEAYKDLDAQPIQGPNIQESKKEIEGTLDTLSEAFENLLDSIFRDAAWDVSSDVTVLHAMLAQEGLIEDDLSRKLKANPLKG